MSEAKTIVVTGIGGRFGRLVVRALHRAGHTIIGIDARPIDDLPKDVEHLRVDLRSKRAVDVFRRRDVGALIHLGLLHGLRSGQASKQHEWNVAGTARLLEMCLEQSVRKVILLSSASLYGPRADNDQFLREDAPLLAAADFPAVRDLVAVDMSAQSFFWRARGSDVDTVILRPVHILGSVRNAPSNYLRLERIPVLMGFDPMVQVIHELDVVDVMIRALEPGVHGIFNVAGPAEVPLSRVVAETGAPTLTIPYSAMRLGLGALWRLRLTHYPVPELLHIRFSAMVDDSRAREELGYHPRRTLREAVQAALAAR
ncbi:MAG: NAD-dependent epimerase/dehydratase family protein [Myxococcales bacterium]|nr:NAD-dependent epimerase/dehydratase family protein [Myxococcales bacterium]